MSSNYFQLLSLLLLSLFSVSHFSLEAYGFNSKAFCIEKERLALLKFKESLKDPSNRLYSWVGEDCCRWMGVGCSNRSGNVVKLDLKNYDCYNEGSNNAADAHPSSCLGGEITTSLLDLNYLNYLDLSMNNFQGIPIPSFFGSLEKLSYLDLSRASFGGMVPPHLGNLSNLRYLDLYSYLDPYSDPYSTQKLKVLDLNWLSRLSFLEYLNLGFVDLNLSRTNWVKALNMLPFLSELHLSGCKLKNLPVSLRSLNFTSLSVLDLSYNKFISSIPQLLYNISLVEINLNFCGIKAPVFSWGDLCNIRKLYLSGNEIGGEISEFIEGLSHCNNGSIEVLHLGHSHLTGQLPDSLGNLKNLKSLQLYYNLISGPIPGSIEKLSHLEELDLSYNKLNGSIPESIRKLTKLTYLQLCENSWEGFMSETHFHGLSELEYFSACSTNTSFIFNVTDEWVPSFSLIDIGIENCQLGPRFPAWLRTQKHLSSIVLVGVNISGPIPTWFWKMSEQINWLDLSNNQIGGILPSSLVFSPHTWIDLSFNRLEGSLPLWSNVKYLILGNNSFSGSIPVNIGQVMPSLRYIFLSGNFLNGSIPSSIGKIKHLSKLDLSDNNLSGSIHDQWNNLQDLLSVDFSWNNLSGTIPSSMCSLPRLYYLKLSSNSLSGELSISLEICTAALTFLDLGKNRITGNIPKWIGESLVSLSELRLRANMLTGNIPVQLCYLSHLHILDLALNNLSGTIPACLGNLSDLSSSTSFSPQLPPEHYTYTPEMDLVVKGTPLKYTSTLGLVNVIDLSGNRLSGEIPEEITNLSTLGALNLSRNQLTGKIPENIGRLQNLETLDLSCNNLSGKIPPNMSSITTLNHLNLSHNNFSGAIPSSNQFLTFNDPSIYEGNPELCGGPLSNRCGTTNEGHGDEEQGHDKDDDEEEDDDKYEMLWFCISVGLGFIVGFWAFFGSLLIKKWRQAYFRFLDTLKDWLFGVIALNVARLRRMMES